MSLDERARSIKEKGGKSLVPFFTAGYPDDETFLRLIEAASRAGCKIIEVGIPFSDPIADGPVIQTSSKHALDGGMSLAKALDLAAEASRENSAELVFMSYFNPILRMEPVSFTRRAREAGVSGLIAPDVPLEESAEIRETLGAGGITFVDLVAPTSGRGRIDRIAGNARGFLYLVSLTGVTGVRTSLSEGLDGFIDEVRQGTDVPLYVGFGISGREQAVRAVRRSDGVIMGSALIKIIQSSRSGDKAVERVEGLLKEVNQAINDSKGDIQ